MFKHLYKTLKIAILSGSLLSFQTLALAQVDGTKGVNTTNSDGTITNTKQYHFDKVTDSDMIAGLAMLAGGFVTGRMIKNYSNGSTPVPNDIMIAGAAGLAFIAGEVISNVKFKGTIDEMTVEVTKKSDGTVNEEQIQRLQDLKKSYEEAKGTTKTKRTLQLASAAAFTVAAIYSGYLAYEEKAAATTCQGAISSGRVSLGVCPEQTGDTSGKSALSCKKCGFTMGALQRDYIKLETTSVTPMPSQAADKAADQVLVDSQSADCKKRGAAGPTPLVVGDSVTAACKLYLTSHERNQAHTKDPTQFSKNELLKDIFRNGPPTFITYESLQSKEADYTYLKSLINLFMPEAKASWIPLLGLGATTAAALFLTTQSVAVETDNFMYNPLNRAFVFAGFAAVAALSAKASGNVIGKLDANIKKIDATLADLAKMAAGVKAQNLQQQQISIKTIDPTSSVASFAKNNSTTTDCLTTNSTTNCPSAANQLQSMPGFANLPDSFKDIASQSVALGDNLSGKTGVTGATLSGAESLAAKQNALSRILKDRQAALEKLTNGKVNFAKGQNNAMERINGALRKSLAKQGLTASGLMASIGGTPISSSASKATEAVPAKTTPAAANVVDTAAKESSGKEKGLDLNFKEDKGENAVAAVDMTGGTTGGTKPAEYEIDSNEINGKNGPSLFEVISSRYIKSGYPKLLEEEPVKN